MSIVILAECGLFDREGYSAATPTVFQMLLCLVGKLDHTNFILALPTEQ